MGGMMRAAQSMMRNPEAMRQMMESPMVQSMMSNPDMMRSMAQSNPQLRELMERRPELRAALSDPETMRQAMRAAMDPRYAAELNSSTDRAMASLEAHPAGMRALQRMWSEVGEPLSSASLSGSPGTTDDADAPSTAPEAPVADPLPNPWGPPAPPSATPATAAARPGASPWGVPRASTATSEASTRDFDALSHPPRQSPSAFGPRRHLALGPAFQRLEPGSHAPMPRAR